MQTSKCAAKKSSRVHRHVCPREAYITDPGALLDALAIASRAEREAQDKVQHAVEARHTEAFAQAAEPTPLHPSLHEDERLARAPSSGAVVIIRRRRAA